MLFGLQLNFQWYTQGTIFTKQPMGNLFLVNSNVIGRHPYVTMHFFHSTEFRTLEALVLVDICYTLNITFLINTFLVSQPQINLTEFRFIIFKSVDLCYTLNITFMINYILVSQPQIYITEFLFIIFKNFKMWLRVLFTNFSLFHMLPLNYHHLSYINSIFMKLQI